MSVRCSSPSFQMTARVLHNRSTPRTLIRHRLFANNGRVPWMQTGAALVFVLILSGNPTIAEDWAQFLGPNRNGVYTGANVVVRDAKTASGPTWKKPVGQGFSAPVVSAGRLVLFHRVGNEERVECVDGKTGRSLWTSASATHYRDDFGFDEGPRSTPTISEGRVYVFGAEGLLRCLDFATGKEIWAVNTHERFGVRKGYFGAACSPLVEGKAVIINVGGPRSGIVAFALANGQVLWTATDDEASYSSPVAVTIQGIRHLLVLTRAGLVDLDPTTGKKRFNFPWRARMQASVNAATPLVFNDLVFISASYATGAALLKISGAEGKTVWSSDDVLSNHYATSVIHEGYLYGYHGRQEQGPSLRCVELLTGKVMWNVDQFRSGTITVANGLLILVKEDGELIFASASPKNFQIKGRVPLLAPTIRAYPALCDGLLYVRNETTLACFDLSK
jgi:outer membrane protein assembly factor BamB